MPIAFYRILFFVADFSTYLVCYAPWWKYLHTGQVCKYAYLQKRCKLVSFAI